MNHQDTITLTKNDDFRIGIDAVSRGDMATASEKLRLLIHHSPNVLPAVITPLTQLSIQSENPTPILFLIADLFSICGYYTEAIQELEEILDIDPKNNGAYQLLGRIWSRAPGHSEVETIFENAIKNDIFDSAVLDVLPKMYIGQFEYGKSVDLFRKLVDRDPSAVHYRCTLANLLSKSNRIDEAIEEFEQILLISPLHASNIAVQLEEMVHIAPDNISLRKTLFNVYCKICQPDEAVTHLKILTEWHPSEVLSVIELLEKASQLFPDSSLIWCSLSRTLVLNQQYSHAVMYLQKAFELPKKPHLDEIINITERILELFPAQVFAMQLLSDIAVYANDYERALDSLEGMTQFDLQDIESIQQRLSRIMELNPTSAHRCHFIRAKLLYNQRHLDQAIIDAQLLIGTELEISGLLLTAQAYQSKGDFTKSESTLFRGLELEPYHPELHHQLRDSKAKYIETITSNTDSTAADHINRGIAYMIQGDYFLALEFLQKISDDDINYGLAQIIIGRCFLDLGRYDQSLNHLQRLIMTADNTLLNHVKYLISINYFCLGEIPKCIETLESILEFDITYGNVQSILALLKQESMLAYRVKAVSASLTPDQQLVVCAIRNSDNAHSQTLSFAHPHNNAGVDYLFKHQYKAAEDEFQLALQMDPNLTVIYCNFAILKLAQRNIQDALALIRRAETINPHYDQCHIIRGLIDCLENRLVDAEQQFQSAYAISATNYITLLNLGDIYYKQKDLKPAFEFWKNTSDMAPIPHLLHHRMGYLIPVDEYLTRWKDQFERHINLELV